jgi:hypothetical protein
MSRQQKQNTFIIRSYEMKTIKAWVTTKKGNRFETILPAKTVVCPDCDGTGTELRGSLKGAVISEESMADDDFRESYFGGDYDVQCSCCKGRNVIEVVDVERLTPKMADRYWLAVEEKAQHDAEVAAERRYFARACGES